jgi:hypothetical protein
VLSTRPSFDFTLWESQSVDLQLAAVYRGLPPVLLQMPKKGFAIHDSSNIDFHLPRIGLYSSLGNQSTFEDDLCFTKNDTTRNLRTNGTQLDNTLQDAHDGVTGKLISLFPSKEHLNKSILETNVSKVERDLYQMYTKRGQTIVLTHKQRLFHSRNSRSAVQISENARCKRFFSQCSRSSLFSAAQIEKPRQRKMEVLNALSFIVV